MTLVGSDLIHVLEDVLPSRFGGGPLDYQLVEEEDEQGLTRISLRVHPRLNVPDESAITEDMLNALVQISTAVGSGIPVWLLNQAQSLRIDRRPPILTGLRRKLMPLHVTPNGGAGRAKGRSG